MRHSFDRDVYNWSSLVLERHGHIFPKTDDPLGPLARVFTLTRSLIAPAPRKIKVASNFVCPEHLRLGYEQLLLEIEQGKDLSPRASRKQRDSKVFVDKMLADWGVHHLHLGSDYIKKGKNKGLVQGNKEILFVYVTQDYVHIIDVFDHCSWAKEKVLQVVHDNWPELIEVYRLPRDVDIAQNITELDRLNYRNSNINTFTKIGDTVYFTPGGGLTCGGLGGADVERSNIVLRATRDLRNWVDTNLAFITDALKVRGVYEAEDELIFEVSKFILTRTFTIQTRNTKMRIHIPSSDEPASLVPPSIAPMIEPNSAKYDYISPTILKNIYIEPVEYSIQTV